MAKINNYMNNAEKPTVWDKVKDFINTGRQYQVQAIEKLPTYYADRINSNKRNSFLIREEEAPQPTTLGGMSYSGDPQLNAYLQDIKSNADKAVYDPRPEEKPAILDKVKNFVDTSRQYQVKAIEDTADYYADRLDNPNRENFFTKEANAPQPTTLGSMSYSGDPEFDAYLQKINTDPDKAVYESRTVEKPVIFDEVKDFVNTGNKYKVQAIEDSAEYYKENIGYSNDGTGKWLKAGAFEDGWQFGDGMKSYVATLADGWRQTKAGVYGLGEKAADTVLMVSPLLYSGLEPAEERSIYPVYSFNPEKRERDKELYGEWVAGDLYDEEAMAKNLYADRLMEKLGIDVERDSMLGEKAKDFSYRAGQEAAVYALGVAGIPTWVTRGVNAFAEEAEHALRSGASYSEALTSALIHAGAEVIVSIVSNNLKYLKVKDKTIGEHAKAFADNMFTKNEAINMSADFMEMMRAHGVDFLKEGSENLFVWGAGKYAESITYQDDKTFIELVTSKEAKREAMENFVHGYLFSFSENK